MFHGEHFRWSDELVVRAGFQLERNWSEVQAKVDAQVATWLQKRCFLKGNAEACLVYIFPLILYSAKESSAGATTIPLQITWWGRRPMLRRQVCGQRPRNGGQGMPDQEKHWFAERLAYFGRSLSKDMVWKRKASDTFPQVRLQRRRELRSEAYFVQECRKALRNLPGSSDLFKSRKELYRDLVVGSASDPLVDRLGWSMEKVHSHWNRALGLRFLNNSGRLHGTRCPFSP